MPIKGPADDASHDDSQDGAPRDTPGDSRRTEARRSAAGPEASPDGPPARPEGLGVRTAPIGLRTAPGWLPAHLLAALNHYAPADSDDTVAEAFCQGGPLDELPPGPTLTAFLIKASAPQHPADASASASAARVPGAVPPSRTEDPGAVPPPQTEDPNTVPPHRTEDQGAGRRASPGTRSGATEDPGAVPPPRTEGTDVPEVAGSCAEPNAGLARVGDNALLGLIRGWRRVASMAAAAELAAVAEFSGRRQAEAKSAGEWDSKAVNAADHEIAAALTLTSRSAGVLIDRAMALRELPATAAALAAGQIDMAKALVLMTGLDGQDPKLARTIEDGLIGRAPAQTTGQLRAALHRALLAADPDAAERRRQAEEKQARVEQMPESGGVTASLAGRHLPVPATVAAWNHITALAGQLRRSGASGTLDELRVHVYLALLSGQATSGLPRGDAKGSPGTKGAPDTESSPDTAAVADPAVTSAPEGTPTPGGTPDAEGTPAPGGTPAPAGTPDPAGTPTLASGKRPAPGPRKERRTRQVRRAPRSRTKRRHRNGRPRRPAARRMPPVLPRAVPGASPAPSTSPCR